MALPLAFHDERLEDESRAKLDNPAAHGDVAKIGKTITVLGAGIIEHDIRDVVTADGVYSVPGIWMVQDIEGFHAELH